MPGVAEGGATRSAAISAAPPPFWTSWSVGRFLRANGMAVGTGRTLTFCRAATVLDPFDRDQLRAAARASLVSRPEDFAKLDTLFDRYFGAGLGTDEPMAADLGSVQRGTDGSEERAGADEPEVTVAPSAASWSPAADDEEEPEEEAAIRSSPARPRSFGRRTSRAHERSGGRAAVRTAAGWRLLTGRPAAPPRSPRVEVRYPTTLRRSLRTEGEPFDARGGTGGREPGRSCCCWT